MTCTQATLAAVASAAIIALAGCGQRPAPQQSLQVSVQPAPLRVGAAQVIARVRDSLGHDVTNARVTVITSRPAVAMQGQMKMERMGRAGQTVVARNEGHGLYHATVHITEPTLWSIVVHAQSDEGFSTQQILERAR